MVDQDEILLDFTRFYIMVILYEGPIHGYGIKKAFQDRLNKNLSFSLIYNFLKKLLDKEYIEENTELIGQKEKKVYTLTNKGKMFAEKMFSRFSTLLDSAIEPNIHTCAGCGVKLFQEVHKEVIDGIEYNFCCHHCADAFKQNQFIEDSHKH